jgi:hypothetical protein
LLSIPIPVGLIALASNTEVEKDDINAPVDLHQIQKLKRMILMRL